MENKNFLGEAQNASHSSSKLKVVFAALLSVVLIVGGVFYFTYNQEDNTPPTLLSYEDNPSLYQGFIKQKANDPNKGISYSLVGFNQDDKDAYAVNFAAWKAANENPIQVTKDEKNGGMVIVYSNKENTFKEVAERIGPEAGAFVIASYQGDQKWRLLENNKYTAPPDVLEVVSIDKMADTKIPAGQAFIVGVLGNTQIFLNDKNVEPDKSYAFCDQKSKGWHLGTIKTTEIKDELAGCLDAVESVWEEVDWYQLPDGKYSNFKKVENFAPVSSHVVWVHFNKAPKKVVADVDNNIATCPYKDPAELVTNLVDSVADRDFVKLFRQLRPTDQKVIDEMYASIKNMNEVTQLSKIAGISKKTAEVASQILQKEDLVKELLNLGALLNISPDELLVAYVKDKDDLILTANYAAKGLSMIERLLDANNTEAFLKNLGGIVVKLEKEEVSKLKDSGFPEFKELYNNYENVLVIIDILKNAKVTAEISADGNTAKITMDAVEGHDVFDDKPVDPMVFELVKADAEDNDECTYWTYPNITETLEMLKGFVNQLNQLVLSNKEKLGEISDLIIHQLPAINKLFENYNHDARISDLVIGLAKELVGLINTYSEQEVEFESHALEADGQGHILIEGYEPGDAFGPMHGVVVEFEGKWYYVPNEGYEGDDFVLVGKKAPEAPLDEIPVRAKKGTTNKKQNVQAAANDPEAEGEQLADGIAEAAADAFGTIHIEAVGLLKITAYSIEAKGVVAPEGAIGADPGADIFDPNFIDPADADAGGAGAGEEDGDPGFDVFQAVVEPVFNLAVFVNPDPDFENSEFVIKWSRNESINAASISHYIITVSQTENGAVHEYLYESEPNDVATSHFQYTTEWLQGHGIQDMNPNLPVNILVQAVNAVDDTLSAGLIYACDVSITNNVRAFKCQ